MPIYHENEYPKRVADGVYVTGIKDEMWIPSSRAVKNYILMLILGILIGLLIGYSI